MWHFFLPIPCYIVIINFDGKHYRLGARRTGFFFQCLLSLSWYWEDYFVRAWSCILPFPQYSYTRNVKNFDYTQLDARFFLDILQLYNRTFKNLKNNVCFKFCAYVNIRNIRCEYKERRSHVTFSVLESYCVEIDTFFISGVVIYPCLKRHRHTIR